MQDVGAVYFDRKSTRHKFELATATYSVFSTSPPLSFFFLLSFCPPLFLPRMSSSGKPQASSIGPSSHRSSSSPLPADALEYFSETAARMGSSGASGMMIQSPDGRPAGIFFQPKPTSGIGTRTPGPISGRRPSADEKFSSAIAANQNRVMNGIPTSSSSSSSSSLYSNPMSSPALGGGSGTPPISTLQQRQKATLRARKSEKVAPRLGDGQKNPLQRPTSPTLPPQPTSAGEVGPNSTLSKQELASSSAHAKNAVAKPSAQPQAGLLIGAGFTPTSKKGGGPKKVAANMVILPPIKVLIVEDNIINVKILSKFLKERKIQFGVAKNGREAVDQWQTGGYHLILMDIQLPVMDGIEATKEIRRLERCANVGPANSVTPPANTPTHSSSKGRLSIPTSSAEDISPSSMLNSLKSSVIIVALTASILNSDRVAALAAGCNDFLNKPVNHQWLERKVIEWGSMQYLIGFRDVNDDYRRQKRYQSLTDREVKKSNGLVEQGFGSGPDRIAQEMAARLHIGARKVR
jgi:osomolarity two-component system response regulator SSK1